MRKVTRKSLWQAASLCTLFVLGGCAETVSTREGQAIHTVPMVYTWSASFEKMGLESAKQDIRTLINKNWDLVANKGLELQWSTNRGKQLATSLRQELIERGVDAKQISFSQESIGNNKDVAVRFHYTKVVTELCTPSKIGQFGAYSEGCFAENARWQAMVNPEKMLSSQPVAK
ncbi:hypothetical protein L1D14_13865 [Vibrio tubiashii]|uniref:hypothetical protein n=1 Tax=Vibrio tubiashii TaxID=29498 RepID=UPI001EFC32F0|nr:hypothetical protein [Vibrio tubiashii]MCG9577319.1 hypothetical protein [Vibrio tubiashii]